MIRRVVRPPVFDRIVYPPPQGFALIVHTPGVSPRSSTRQGFRPDRPHTRGFAPQGFALGYGPPGLQPGRVQGSAL